MYSLCAIFPLPYYGVQIVSPQARAVFTLLLLGTIIGKLVRPVLGKQLSLLLYDGGFRLYNASKSCAGCCPESIRRCRERLVGRGPLFQAAQNPSRQRLPTVVFTC